MAKYYWHNGEWVEKKPVTQSNTPYIWNDLPEYVSPLSFKPVDGRRARREEMKRFNVREVDPSERPEGAGIPKTQAQADAERRQLEARPKYEMPAHIKEQFMKGNYNG